MLVYLATFPNGKFYVGCTSRTLRQRVADHRNVYTRVDNKLYRAMLKHGFDSVEWSELCRCATRSDMLKAEIAWIASKDSRRKGYNSTLGGEGAFGRKNTPEQSAKHAERQRIRFTDPAQRQKASEAGRLYAKQNPQQVKATAEKIAKHHRTPEARKQASEKALEYAKSHPACLAEKGQRLSLKYATNPESRAKISRALGGKPIQVSRSGLVIGVFPTLSQCARDLNLSLGNVSSVLAGQRCHVHGYSFKRLEV